MKHGGLAARPARHSLARFAPGAAGASVARMIRLVPAPLRPFAAPLALLALAGCGPSENHPGPGGVTVGEAQALDEAAEMIEQRRLPPEALPAEPASGAQPTEAGE